MGTFPTKQNSQDTVLTPEMRAHPLVMLIDAVLPIWARHLASIGRHSELAVSDMLQECAHLRAQVNGQLGMHESVDRLLQAFQYQDRLSQRIRLLEGDIAHLIEVLSEKNQPIPEVSAWLSRLESQYAMQDQVQDHNGQCLRDASHGAGQDAQFF